MPFEFVLSACLMLTADQTSKELVLRRQSAGGPICAGGPGIRIRVLINPHPGFGTSRSRGWLVALWTLLVPLLLLQTSFIPQWQTSPSMIALGAAVGGATSNLADLLWRGGVVDFIDLRLWPVFNPADAAISCGAGYLAWTLLNDYA